MKKIEFLLFVLLMCGLTNLAASTIFAQKTSSLKNEMPKDNLTANATVQRYIDMSLMPMNLRRSTFNDLTAEEKANLVRLHLAFQFIKRPNLSEDQRDVILEGIRMTSADSYRTELSDDDSKSLQEIKSFEMKAKSLFDKREGFEIFASLGGSRENAGVLQKYRELASLPSRAEMRHRFSGIPPVEKADFWRVKSVIPLALDRSLSTEQEHFLVKAIYLIKPEFYEIQENSVEWKVLDESLQTFSKQAIELFGRERGNEIFAMCGESTVGVQNAIGDCQCSAISDWCSRNPCSTATSCAQTRGCGTLWVYRCTGLCIGWR